MDWRWRRKEYTLNNGQLRKVWVGIWSKQRWILDETTNSIHDRKQNNPASVIFVSGSGGFSSVHRPIKPIKTNGPGRRMYFITTVSQVDNLPLHKISFQPAQHRCDELQPTSRSQHSCGVVGHSGKLGIFSDFSKQGVSPPHNNLICKLTNVGIQCS